MDITKALSLHWSLNPLGIGEGFEPKIKAIPALFPGLNPLGIGEGFELTQVVSKVHNLGLNPLGIGEGFEPLNTLIASGLVSVS